MPAGSILVADDDTAIRTVLNQALSRAGYEVRLTGNAATLWRWVSQGEGDLVITDVVMPDENAFDLLQRIKKMRPNLPVILSSGYTGEVLTAAEDTPWPLLRKPYGPEQLARVIAEVTPRADSSVIIDGLCHSSPGRARIMASKTRP